MRPYENVLSLRLPTELLNQLKTMAEENGLPVTSVIRMILTRTIAKPKNASATDKRLQSV